MKFRRHIPSISVLYNRISKNNLQSSSITTDELWYSRIFGRKISVYFTWILLSMGMTPNQSTLLSFLLGIVGLYFFSFKEFAFTIIGFVFFHLYIIIDSSDGEMARFLDMKSEIGAFYDKLLHYLMKIGIIIVISLQIYNRVEQAEIIILGLVVAIISGFSSTFYHLLPRNNFISYAQQVREDGMLISYIRKFFRLITGDIELSIVLFILLVLEKTYKLDIVFPLVIILLSQGVLLIVYLTEQLYRTSLKT